MTKKGAGELEASGSDIGSLQALGATTHPAGPLEALHIPFQVSLGSQPGTLHSAAQGFPGVLPVVLIATALGALATPHLHLPNSSPPAWRCPRTQAQSVKPARPLLVTFPASWGVAAAPLDTMFPGWAGNKCAAEFPGHALCPWDTPGTESYSTCQGTGLMYWLIFQVDSYQN